MPNKLFKKIVVSLLLIFSTIISPLSSVLSCTESSAAMMCEECNFTDDYHWSYEHGAWHLCDSNGFYYYGWYCDGYNTYFFDEFDGHMKTGWLWYYDTWYYFDADGSMHTGWLPNNNTLYYLNEDGSLHTEWLYDNDKWYYFNDDGSIHKGWLYNYGYWYYFNNDGSMYVGWLYDGNNWYYFYPYSGIMAYDTYVDGYYLDYSGAWVY